MGLRIALASLIDRLRGFHEDPDGRLREIGLREGMTFLDVGCTLGFYTFPASSIVGESGLVIALDINPELIERVSRKAERSAFGNVETLVADACETGLPSESVDIVFLHLVLHDIDDKPRAIREFDRVLRPRGRLVINEENAMELGEVRDLVGREGYTHCDALRKTIQVFRKEETDEIGLPR